MTGMIATTLALPLHFYHRSHSIIHLGAPTSPSEAEYCPPTRRAGTERRIRYGHAANDPVLSTIAKEPAPPTEQKGGPQYVASGSLSSHCARAVLTLPMSRTPPSVHDPDGMPRSGI